MWIIIVGGDFAWCLFFSNFVRVWGNLFKIVYCYYYDRI